jgi:hypothetical protein
MDNWGRNAGVLVADEAKVVIPIPAHLNLLVPASAKYMPFQHGRALKLSAE